MPTYDEKAILIGAGLLGLGVLAYSMSKKKDKDKFLVGDKDNPGMKWSDGCLPSAWWGGFPYEITDAGAYTNFRRQVVYEIAQDKIAGAKPAGPGLAAPVDATLATDDALAALGGGSCPAYRNMPATSDYERLREYWAGLHADVVTALRTEVERQQDAGGTGYVYEIQGIEGNV